MKYSGSRENRRSWRSCCSSRVAGFEPESDARRFMALLEGRLERFHLRLNRSKTRLLDFGRASHQTFRHTSAWDEVARADGVRAHGWAGIDGPLG